MIPLNKVLNSKKSEFLVKIRTKQFKELLKQLNMITDKYILPRSSYDRSHLTPYNLEILQNYKISTYINASFVTNQFIAMQMPKDNFFNDFIVFIKKSKCKFIISLINCENEDYFLEEELISRTPIFLDNKLIFYDEMYELNLQKIRRLRYLCWEDFCAPKKDEFLKFITYFYNINYEKRVFVHCMGGFGRTGTFIMYNSLIKLKNVTDEDFLDVLIELRTKRCNLVETVEQLEFLFNLFVE